MSLRDDLFQRLSTRQSQNLKLELNDYACVAIILKGDAFENLEVGFIQRATHPDDSWSGQLAFPGGRRHNDDLNDFGTAVRETREEVGIDLHNDEFLGVLNDIQGRKGGALLGFFIRPFVFYIEREPTTKLDPTEVADFFWVPLKHLTAPERQTQIHVERENTQISLPAIQLGKEPVLWGLTYLMTQDLLDGLIAA